MSPVGISRYAMPAVSRSAQSGGRRNRDGTRLHNKSRPNRCARSPDTACREEATGRVPTGATELRPRQGVTSHWVTLSVRITSY